MASLSELQSVRREKLEILKAAGMNPFAVSVPKTHSLADLRTIFVELSDNKTIVSVVGRVMSIRGQGAILFVTLQDGTGSFQVVFKKDSVPESLFTLFAQAVDLADSISVTGIPFVTQRGEPSVEVTDWVIATKALLPLPDKVQGIQDEELKTRKRYIDAIMDPMVYNRFITRSKIISYIRNYFDTRGFLEIETPILQNQAGGAMAQTFNTYHNDYDMPMVLRIALELEHKMMMVAGYPMIYEIGKTFRNEGTDPTHMQEFTMIEWYAAYHTLEENMNWTQELLQGLARDVIGREAFTVYDKSGNATEVSFAGQWPRINFADALREKNRN